jgi:hypothetical protein
MSTLLSGIEGETHYNRILPVIIFPVKRKMLRPGIP